MTDQGWAMKGELVLSCNCTVFCPCVLSLGNHAPTEGYCQTWAGFRIDAGHFGEVDLSGLNLGLIMVRWRQGAATDNTGKPISWQGYTRRFSAAAGW